MKKETPAVQIEEAKKDWSTILAGLKESDSEKAS